jgi:hypothetical protein
MAGKKTRSTANRNRNRGRSGARRGGSNRIIWIILLLALLLVGGWYYGTPYWTLHQMREAVRDHDGAALAEHIDTPALRENLSRQMRAKLSIETHKEEGLGALGAILAGAMIGPLIDRMVSPDGLQALLDGVPAGGGPAKPTALTSKKPEIDHDGVSGFRVHDPRHAAGEGDLIFKREGIAWKLVAIDLPGMSGR